MDKGVASSSSSHDVAQRLYDKNIELENRRRKSAQARVPSDPNAWQQMRENFETIILEDHSFSEKHNIEFALWQLHYRRIEEFRAHYSAASASVSSTTQTRGGPARPDRASKIRSQFKTFLSEATGFYHDLILKIRAKYGLPIGQFYPEQDNHVLRQKDGKKSIDIKKGLISCHRCLIYLGDLARYKGLYGEGESKNRDYAAASSYYLQAASLWPSSGNPHHQLAILATYSGDELMAVYRYFRSLAAEQPFSTAKDNLIVAFEKNRQSYTQLHVDSNDGVKESSVKTKGRGRGKEDPVARSKEPVTETEVVKTPTVRQTLKVFRVGFVRLNGVLFTHTSLETFEDILPVVISALQELLPSGSGDESGFGTDADENGLFIVILVSILIFTVNNVKGGTEGQSYADIVQNTVLLKNALITFYEITGQLLKRCIQLSDPFSSFLLPGILVCVEWIACNLDVVISKETGERRSVAQTKFWSYCVSLFNKFLSAGLVSYDEEDTSCFTDMTSYEEGSNEYQSALWEDFELRGFLPLEPAHTFLDFSRKHLDGKKDQVARVKRIMSAWRIISDKITIDHKKVRFDPKLKKFVIGAIGIETEKETSGSKLYRGTKESSSDTTATVIPKQLKVEARVECEEEEEEIVFRPNLIDNRTEVLNQQEVFENTSQTAAPNVSMPQSNLDAVYNNSQSLLPADSYAQSFGQPVNNSYTQSVVPPVNNSYTQSVVPPVNNNYAQSVGPPVPPVNNNYAQSVGPPGPPVNNNYAQSVGPSVNNSYSQSIGQIVNDSYIQNMGQPVNNNFTHNIGQSYQFQSPMWSGNRQVVSSVAGGLQGLSLRENGHSGGSGMMHTGPSQSMARPPVIDYSNTVALSETDSYAMARYTSTNMPPSSLKAPMNRPIRHFGPPPGFSSVRPKQVNEPSSASGQNPLNDDYSWLDGYQLQSSMKGGFHLPSNMNSQYPNDSVATSSFPFPGKQVPTVRFEGELQKNMDQQQYVTQMDQQGQPVWKGNHFV